MLEEKTAEKNRRDSEKILPIYGVDIYRRDGEHIIPGAKDAVSIFAMKAVKEREVAETILNVSDSCGQFEYKNNLLFVKSILYRNHSSLEYLSWEEYIKFGKPERIIVEESSCIRPFYDGGDAAEN